MRRLALRFSLFCACLWCACLAAPEQAAAQSARVSMSASSNRVGVGEPFAIEVRIETRGDDPDSIELPDFSDFEVLARSTSRPFSFSFGFGSGGQRAQVKSETIYGFTLRANQRGAHTIRPAIVTVNGRRIASQSLNVMVLDPSSAGLPGGRPTLGEPAPAEPPPNAPPAVAGGASVDGAKVDPTMFVRTVVDKKRAYLGEQVTVTIYLYLRGQLGDSPQFTREATLDGFWSNDLLPMQRSMSSTRQEIQGRSYNAYILRRLAAFPLRTGTLELGAPAVEVGSGGSIFDLLNGPSRPLRREGVKVAVEVLPLPPHPTRHAPTHTGTLSLEATLDSATAKVGEAVTLRVVAKGLGNMRGLTLPTPRLPNVETLAPEIDDQVGSQLDLLGGERTFRWLLLPRQPGTVTIPSFVVDTFDPATEKFTPVRTTPMTLTVSGAASAASAPSPSAPTDPSSAAGGVSDAVSDASGLHFGPLRTHSELARGAPPLRARSWFWPSVLAAPLLLLVFYLTRLVRRVLAQRRSSGQGGTALHEVDEKLGQAERASKQGDASTALSALAGALKKTLEVCLGEPVGGLTSRALEAHLSARALPPTLIERVLGQLGAIERARFDPGSQGAVELQHALAGVRSLIGELTRFRSKSAR